jgi:broad specificity phosphatase PhoE
VRTVVHLLRHGEVDNPAGVLYGRLPGFGLSAEGRAMAERAGAALAGRDLTLVASSPLERAVQTAERLARRASLPVVIDDRLIEAANDFEGRRFGLSATVVREPSTWWALRNPLRPSWGEPYEQVADRMLAAVHEARSRSAGHEAVLVSHQLPIWVLRRRIEGHALWHRPDRRQCALASLTSLFYDGDDVVAVHYTEPAGTVAARSSTPGA